MAYYHGHYREAIRGCTPYLLDEYAIPCNVDELITFLYSRGHLSDDQTQFINEHERTRDRMRLLLEDMESNANIGKAFDDMLEHMSTDDRRQDIPTRLGETLQRIARTQNNWQYIEAIRKCLPFLTKNISKPTLGDIVDHMAGKGHIHWNEQQYIHETTRMSEKHKMLFGYMMETQRDNKAAFTDLIEKLYEDKFREDIPKKLEETLDAIKKTTSEHEDHVNRTLKRLDILYIPEEKGTDQLIKESAQHSGDSNLFDAAMRSDYETFDRLLQDSDDPDAINRRNENGQTPLIVSCKYADVNFVQKLIENDATDVNARDIKGRTAFFYAIMRCDKKLVSLLINCSQVDISTRDHCGLTFVWCIFGENLANDLASTVKSMYMEKDKMAETFVSIIREKRTDLNWEKIMDIVRILVQNEKVNDIELLKTMILASHVPTVSYILQHANIPKDHGDMIYDIILNGIGTNNVDIFRLLLECPNITLGLLNMWSVNALLKYTLTSHSSRSIKAMMLKLSRGIRVDPALKAAISLLCLDDEAVPLPEILEGYDMTRLNVSDSEHNTVFMILCQYGSEALVSELLKHPEINFMAENTYHQTPFTVALKSRSEEVALLLLQHIPSHVDVNKCDRSGENGLLLACKSKCDAIVRVILEQKGVDVNLVDKQGNTALMWASRGGHDTTVSMLLDRSDVDANLVDKEGNTALIVASAGGRDRTVSLLLKRSDVNINAVSKFGRTALMEASMRERGTTVSMLLGRSDVNVNALDIFGRTALMRASMYGHDTTVSLLLERSDVDVNLVDKDGLTALMWASRRGRDKIVSMLLGRSDVDVNVVDKEGNTALIVASVWGHDTIVSMLLERSDVDVNLVDTQGNTALVWASARGHDKIVSVLLDRSDVNVNTVDKYGRTALMEASEGGHVTTVSLLLGRSDVDVNVVDEDGRTALMEASEGGHVTTVSLLLGRSDVDVDLVDEDGRTALVWASICGHDTTVSLLLERRDVDVNVVDEDGLTAMMLASGEGHAGVVDMLMARGNVDSNSTDC